MIRSDLMDLLVLPSGTICQSIFIQLWLKGNAILNGWNINLFMKDETLICNYLRKHVRSGTFNII